MAIGQFQTIYPMCPTGPPVKGWPKHPDTRWKNLSGLGALGQPEVLMTQLTAAQDELSIANAELHAIPKEAWNQAAVPRGIPTYGTVENMIGFSLRSVIYAGANVEVSILRLLSNARKARGVAGAVRAWVRVLAPYTGATENVKKESIRMAEAVAKITPLRSPSVVGWNTFRTELFNRARNLAEKAKGAFNWLKWGIIGVVVLGVVSTAMRFIK